SDEATYFADAGRIILPKRATVAGNGMEVEGSRMEGELEVKKGRLVQNVKTKIEPDKVSKKDKRSSPNQMSGGEMGYSMPRVSLFLLLLSASTVIGAGDAATPAKDESKTKGGTAFEFNKKDPIYINSDWMEFDQTKNTITYKGRVVTTQGEMTLRSDTLT